MSEKPGQYQIVAQIRGTKRRVPVAGPFSQETAKAWVASGYLKKSYRYFRVSKVKDE